MTVALFLAMAAAATAPWRRATSALAEMLHQRTRAAFIVGTGFEKLQWGRPVTTVASSLAMAAAVTAPWRRATSALAEVLHQRTRAAKTGTTATLKATFVFGPKLQETNLTGLVDLAPPHQVELDLRLLTVDRTTCTLRFRMYQMEPPRF